MKKFSSYILVLAFILASCGQEDECDFSKINSAPVITNNSDEYIIMKENQTYAFTVNANDEDRDDLYFDINVKEDGGEFTSGSTFFNATYLKTIDKWTGGLLLKKPLITKIPRILIETIYTESQLLLRMATTAVQMVY